MDDFWTKPGYLGTEQSPLGDVVRAALAEVGDTPDNRWDIALRTYYRHQVPPASDGYYGFDQFRNPDGTPRYPQRQPLVGPLVFGSVSGGAAYNGQINGKMIVVDNLYDVDALPWHADWYAKRVRAALGDEGVPEQLPPLLQRPCRSPRRAGDRDQSEPDRLLRPHRRAGSPGRGRLGRARCHPAPVDELSGQRQLRSSFPAGPPQRRGIQPVVDLTVRGGDRITVKAGQRVRFSAKAQVPPRHRQDRLRRLGLHRNRDVHADRPSAGPSPR